MPVSGRPASLTLPVADVQVGWPIESTRGAAGRGRTVTVVEGDGSLRHPAAFLTLTEYIPDVVTVMLLEVAPVDQR